MLKQSRFFVAFLIVSLASSFLTFYHAGAQSPIYLKTFEKEGTILRIPTINIIDSVVTSQNTKDFYQFNITLKKPPETNILNIPLETSGLEFYPQPPLTLELNPKEYAFINDTHALNEKGEVMMYRPENIVDSYAVYMTNPKANMTGKLYHIYRPLLIDAKGATSWAKLAVSKIGLTVIMDERFLADATYPLVVDPTFGYDTAGGTAIQLTNVIAGSTYNLPENGDVSDIRVRMFVGASGLGLKAAIYDTSGNLQTTSAELNPDPDYSTNWWTLSVSPSDSLTSGDYRISAWTSIAGSYFYYDSGGTNQWGQNATSYGSWPDPIIWGSQADRKLSIYATYTATGGGTNYTAELSQNVSSSLNIAPQWTTTVTLSQSLAPTWGILTQWNALASLSQAITLVPTILIQSAFQTTSSLSLSFSWVVDIVQSTLGGVAYVADLTLGTLFSWATQLQWNALVGLSQSLLTSWSYLTGWDANIDLSLGLVTSWVVAAWIGVQQSVTLTLDVVTSWAVDLLHSVGVNLLTAEDVLGVAVGLIIVFFACSVSLIFVVKRRNE